MVLGTQIDRGIAAQPLHGGCNSRADWLSPCGMSMARHMLSPLSRRDELRCAALRERRIASFVCASFSFS
jgi:hypothetical protein